MFSLEVLLWAIGLAMEPEQVMRFAKMSPVHRSRTSVQADVGFRCAILKRLHRIFPNWCFLSDRAVPHAVLARVCLRLRRSLKVVVASQLYLQQHRPHPLHLGPRTILGKGQSSAGALHPAEHTNVSRRHRRNYHVALKQDSHRIRLSSGPEEHHPS